MSRNNDIHSYLHWCECISQSVNLHYCYEDQVPPHNVRRFRDLVPSCTLTSKVAVSAELSATSAWLCLCAWDGSLETSHQVELI